MPRLVEAPNLETDCREITVQNPKIHHEDEQPAGTIQTVTDEPVE